VDPGTETVQIHSSPDGQKGNQNQTDWREGERAKERERERGRGREREKTE